MPRSSSRSPSYHTRHSRAARYRALHRRARWTLFTCILALSATIFLLSAGLSRGPSPSADPLPAPENSQQPAVTPAGGEDTETRRTAILQDTSGTFPESLRALLERHPDALDFVEGYPDHKDDAPAGTVGQVADGEYPLLLQWDPRWGYVYYGDNLLAVTGCGPTCLAMAAVGLLGDDTITPAAVAEQAQQDGYWTDGVTSWGLMRTGCQAWGLVSEELPLTESAVTRALNDGRPVICSMRPGDFTTTGHFILLTEATADGIRVNDPNSPQNSDRLWTYAELEPQIRNLWAFSIP